MRKRPSLAMAARERPSPAAWHIYVRLDLGPGGSAKEPSEKSRKAARRAIERSQLRH